MSKALTAEQKLARKQRLQKQHALYLDKITETILGTIFETGHPPHAHSGKVEHGPLAGQEWTAINVWLFKYNARNPNCGFSSIPTFIHASAILTPDVIAETIYATFKATGNRQIPSRGIVRYGPYAGRIKWNEFSEWIEDFSQRNPNCNFNSLATFIDTYNPKERPINASLKLLLIEETVRETAKTGYKTPISKDTLQHGPYREQTSSFNLDAWLRKYARKHPDCGFNSLPSFIDTLGIEGYDTLKPAKKTCKPALPLKQITTAKKAFNISASHIKRTGQLPTMPRGIVSSNSERASVQQINRFIKSGLLKGLAVMFRKHACHPDNYKSFLLLSGLAQMSKDGKTLLPKLDL